jgi:hypothetical protein
MDNTIIKKGILAKAVSGESFNLPEVVSCIQGFCLGLRLEHWETKGFAAHKATEMIQESLEGSLDAFVGAAVGMNEGKRPSFGRTVMAETDCDKTIDCLKGISVKDTSILNIRDEMLQALYKLKYLRTLS